MFRKSVALVAALLFVLSITSAAQNRSAQSSAMANVAPEFFQGLRYRLVGPSRGGRVTTVTGVPSQPKTFYMGVASGGLFRTIDGGASWFPVTDGQVPLGSTGAVEVSLSDPKAVYPGAGSADLRSNVWKGRRVDKAGGHDQRRTS